MTLNEHIGYYLFVVIGIIPLSILLLVTGIEIFLLSPKNVKAKPPFE